MVVDGDDVEGEEDRVEEAGEDGWKDVEKVHDGLDQEHKHGEDNDDDVVACDEL